MTFDENFHVPAGVVALTRADFSTSFAQPPLARAFYGAAALVAGARLPDAKAERPGYERDLGESFMRRNADRYARVFLASRLVAIAFSTLLGWWIGRCARVRFGPVAGLIALATWCLSPEALAHGSLAGVDVPTALVFFGAVMTGSDWLRSGRWRDWTVSAAWIAAAFLVRFNAAQVLLVLCALALLFAWRRTLASPSRIVVGLGAFAAVVWLGVAAGYRFQGLGAPLRSLGFFSPPFMAITKRFADLPAPLPGPYLRGLDYITFLAQPGTKWSYLLGELTQQHRWAYFPVAIAVKWPLGVLGLIAARLVHLAVRRDSDPGVEATLLLPALLIVGTATSANLDYGVRYVLPALPFLLVWVSALAAPPANAAIPRARTGATRWRWAAVLLAIAIPVEAARCMPYPLAFFNAFASAPGAGERIVNDSNVDWGQGLIALRADMARLGIRRIHLAYHGTTDPALYGIDYVPYMGGTPGPESDWLAISSYFYVGLPARLMTRAGYSSQANTYDARGLWSLTPAAHPAHCMWLFRVVR